MTKLSVNINKIATIRNARGGFSPNVVEAAINCQKFGADGVTIHPRPDERHITRKDVYDIKPIISTEFNIEGYPSEDFINMVLEINPEQVTLVPDGPSVITSCAGWDTIKFQDFLKEIIFSLNNRLAGREKTSILLKLPQYLLDYISSNLTLYYCQLGKCLL